MKSLDRNPLYVGIALAVATAMSSLVFFPTTAMASQPGSLQTNSAVSASKLEPSDASYKAQAKARKNRSKKEMSAQKTGQNKNKNHQQLETKLKGVVVTGFTQSVLNALAQERNANAVVDVVNAQSVSQFPSKDVADALKRLPGVVVSEDGGEGKTVSIRGLTPGLTLTLLNDNYVANATPEAGGISRSYDYLLLPSQLIGSVDVYKSQEAKLTAGGIGGTVILHTRKPLSLRSGSGFVSLKGTSSDTVGKPEPRLTAMYNWHNKADNFGVLIAAGYQKRDVQGYHFNPLSSHGWSWWSPGETTANFSKQPPLLANGKPLSDPQDVSYFPIVRNIVDQAGNQYSGFWMPQEQVATIRKQHRIRKSAQLTVQYAPTQNFQLTGNAFFFGLNNDNFNYELHWVNGGLGTQPFSSDQGNLLAPDSMTFDPSHTVVTGLEYVTPPSGKLCNALVNPSTGATRTPASLCANRWPLITGGYNRQNARSRSVNIKGVWTAGIVSMTFNVGRSWANGGDQLHLRYGVNPNIFKNGQWVNASNDMGWSTVGKPSFTFSTNTLAAVRSGDARLNIGITPGGSTSVTKSSGNYGEIDLSVMPDISWIDSLQFGVKYTDQHGSNFSTAMEWICPGTDEEFQVCGNNAQLPQFYQKHSLTTNSKAFSVSQFPALDFANILAYLDSEYGSPQPFNQTPLGSSSLIMQHEAAYFQMNYEYGRLRGNVGARVVRTLRDTNVGAIVTTLLQNYYQDVPGPSGTVLICPPDGKNKIGAQCTPGNPELRPADEWQIHTTAEESNFKAFTKVLPSVNIIYTLPHNVQLRGAWSEAMSPPSYGQLLQGANLQDNTLEWFDSNKQYSSVTRTPGWYGSASNPDRKALTAKQYDVGAAWYPLKGSVLSVDYFHKNITNFAVPVDLVNSKVDLNGVTETVRDFTTVGNGKTSSVHGYEVAMQYVAPFGVGALANYTRLKSKNANVEVDGKVVGTSKLTGSADYTGNLSIFYQNHRFLVRASENWIGSIVDGLVTGLTNYIRPYKQIDVNAHYKLTPKLMLSASVINVNEAMHKQRLGDDTFARLTDLVYSGRQYYLGLTYNF